ncbi:MAG: site-2 protease family protein, partial [Candidatus Sericytochromatia bacterium]|nr:site-2 protease family protein [Candidatus Tanganyikabacteria bacterium]
MLTLTATLTTLASGVPRVLFMILVLAVIIVVHEFGHYLMARAMRIPVSQFWIGFPPTLASFNFAGTKWCLNALPLGGACVFVDDMAQDEADAARTKGQGLFDRPRWQQFLVMMGGILANIVFAWLAVMVLVSTAGIPSTKALSIEKEGIAVGSVFGEGAKNAGLEAGDRIMSVDGKAFEEVGQLPATLKEKAGQTVVVHVLRPEKDATRSLQLKAVPDKDGKLGMQISAPGELIFKKVESPIAALSEGTRMTYSVAEDTVKSLGMLITGKLPLSMLGGPVAIVHVGVTVVHRFVDVCMFAATISISLA